MYTSILALTLLTSTTFASLTSHSTLHKRTTHLSKRQSLTTCSGLVPNNVPNPCEIVCGAEAQTCVSRGHCMIPGDDCCSNGHVCAEGSYCAIIKGAPGCCREGQTLEECGASETVATVPGSAETGGSSLSSSSSTSSSAGASSTSTTISTTAVPTSPPVYGHTSNIASSSSTLLSSTTFGAGPTSPSHPQPHDYSAYSPAQSSKTVVVPTAPVWPTTTRNGTLPSYTPAQQTTNAGARIEVAGWIMGGLGALGMAFLG